MNCMVLFYKCPFTHSRKDVMRINVTLSFDFPSGEQLFINFFPFLSLNRYSSCVGWGKVLFHDMLPIQFSCIHLWLSHFLVQVQTHAFLAFWQVCLGWLIVLLVGTFLILLTFIESAHLNFHYLIFFSQPPPKWVSNFHPYYFIYTFNPGASFVLNGTHVSLTAIYNFFQLIIVHLIQ